MLEIEIDMIKLLVLHKTRICQEIKAELILQLKGHELVQLCHGISRKISNLLLFYLDIVKRFI